MERLLCSARPFSDIYPSPFHQSPSRYAAANDLSDAALIDVWANALVEIQPRGRARDQIRDADKLLHELLLPMSFPWAHPCVPINKVMPYDLEDMPAILAAGSSIPAVEEHGEFGHLRSRRTPRSTQVAARRSNDPGVVEFTSFFSPSQAQRHAMSKSGLFDPSEQDPTIDGELSLRMYKEVQDRKRKRLMMEHTNKKTKFISFRLGSASSRSSIFADIDIPGCQLLLLPAQFPKSIQEGMRLSGEKAFETAHELGAYNIRPVPPEALALNDTSYKNRIFVGRSRIIWSEKDDARSISQRVPYRSLLTGDRLEGSSAKRPIQVKVAIRINGILLASNGMSAKEAATLSNDAAWTWDDSLSYSNRVVNGALDIACRECSSDAADHSQCRLASEVFLKEVTGQAVKSGNTKISSLLKRTRQELRIQRDTATSSRNSLVERGQLLVTPPCIDCVPTEDGIYSVVCTKPGALVWGSVAKGSRTQPKRDVSTMVLRELSIDLKCCSICWNREAPLMNDGSSTKCSTCGVRVHSSCLLECQDKGTWNCRACTLEVADSECVCSICNHSGGELFEDDDGSRVHKICKTWCYGSKDTNDTTCHLCSEKTNAVARCAATNCSIQFHPMCAVIASISANEHFGDLKQGGDRERDAYLCSQHQLSMLHTTFRGGGCSDMGCSTMLPVALCGYHNPLRRDDYYGLYPGGSIVEFGAMRIPPDRST